MYNDYHTLLYDTKLKGVEESFRHLDEYESVLISIPNYTTLPCSLSDRPLLMSSTNMKSGWAEKYKNWKPEISLKTLVKKGRIEETEEKMSTVEKAQVAHAAHLVEELLFQVCPMQ